jgi:hypothetical protein
VYIRHFRNTGRFFLCFRKILHQVILWCAYIQGFTDRGRLGAVATKFCIFFLYRHPVLFVNQNLYLLSERTLFLEGCAFRCHLLHVSADVGHHQVDFTTCKEKNSEVEASPTQLIHWNTQNSDCYRLISAHVQTGPGAHPASCTMGTGYFPGVESGRGVTLTHHPLLVPRSKNRVELYLYCP